MAGANIQNKVDQHFKRNSQTESGFKTPVAGPIQKVEDTTNTSELGCGEMDFFQERTTSW